MKDITGKSLFSVSLSITFGLVVVGVLTAVACGVRPDNAQDILASLTLGGVKRSVSATTDELRSFADAAVREPQQLLKADTYKLVSWRVLLLGVVPWTLLAAFTLLQVLLTLQWLLAGPKRALDVVRDADGRVQSKHVLEDSDKLCSSEDAEEGKWDVVIMGAGVAGAPLAAYLGRRGKRVLVIERDLSEMDRIVGELMQPCGVAKLREMGMGHALEGIDAAPVDGYGIVLNHKGYSLLYPRGKDGKRVHGVGLHNGRLLQSLRQVARDERTVELRAGTVTKLLRRDGRITGLAYRDPESREIRYVRAPLTVVSDGCSSFFKSSFSTAEVEVRSKFLGLIIRDAPLPFKAHGHVILSEPTPMLCYPISSNEARVLIDFPDGHLPQGDAMTKHMLEHVLPQFPAQLQDSFRAAVKERNFKAMPNRAMTADPWVMPGVVLVGDSLNMRHPLTGGGMTCAFKDIHLLGQSLMKVKDFEDRKAITAAVERFYRQREGPNAVINVLAEALYDVMSAKNPELRQACFEYLNMGAWCSNGPVAFLSGLSSSQSFLVFHFFAVAVFATLRTVLPLPTPYHLYRAFASLRAAVGIITPRLQRENIGLMTHLFCGTLRTIFVI